MSLIKQYNAKSGAGDTNSFSAGGATVGDDQSGVGGTESTGTSGQILSVKMTAEAVAGTRNCVISNVRLVCRIKTDTSSTTDFLFAYKWDEPTPYKYDSGWSANVGSYTEHYYDWANEPWSVSAWTWGLLDTLDWGASVYKAGATWQADHTYILVTVEPNKTGTSAITLPKPVLVARGQRTNRLNIPIITLHSYGTVTRTPTDQDGIGIANITSGITSFTAFKPIKIDVAEEFNDNTIAPSYGQYQYTKRNSFANISLEFDAISEATLFTWQSIMLNRKYEKKLYVNFPADTLQTQDFNTVIGTSNIIYDTPATLSLNLTPSGTAFVTADYNKIKQIDSTAWISPAPATNYCVVYITFDLADYLTIYSADTIDRMTLFLHNPYCTVSSKHSGYGVSVFDPANNKWIKIGGQGLSVSDSDLRTVGKINQQFVGVKKVHDFDTLAKFIDSDAMAYGNTTVTFAIYNTTASLAYELGFNYVGFGINCYGVQQTNNDVFTFRNSYTLSGLTGTVELGEI